MEKQKQLTETERFVLSAVAQNDSAHDVRHITRVVKIALQLAQNSGADCFRTQMLSLLHETNDDKLSSNIGPGAVEAFLRSIELPEREIAFLLAGIPYISYRHYPKLEEDVPLEIRIVQDADRIDAMGAVGIARTFAYGGAKGRSLEESLAHFDEKLLKLYDLLSTPAAKAYAKSRYAFLESFYRQFREEIQ
jgi:uncharacterized protein